MHSKIWLRRQSPEDQVDVGTHSKLNRKLQKVDGWGDDIIQLLILKVIHTTDWLGTVHEWRHGDHLPSPYYVLLWIHRNVETCTLKCRVQNSQTQRK